MATTKRSAPLDPKIADKLLDRLGTDNEFRRLFKKNPQAALAQVGHPESKAAEAALRKGPPFQPPGPPPVVPPIASCMGVQRIATKAQVMKAREELKAMLTAGLGMTPIQLNVATTASRRMRR